MKKVILTALILTLAITVAWANEITLSPDSDSHAVVTGDNPGVVPVPPKGEHNGEETLSWDDGEMDDTWQDIFSRAVQFTAPVDCHAIEGQVYLESDGVLFVPYFFAIYDDNGGVPGKRIGGTISTGGGIVGWDNIDIIPVGVTLMEGEVFYGVVVKNNSDSPVLCADTTESIHGHFYQDPSQFDWTFDETANFMLRVVVDDDMNGPFTENPNPAPGDSGLHGDTTVTFEIHDETHEVKSNSIIVVIGGKDVTDDCSIAKISVTGDYIVSFTPEKDFFPGDIYVYWYAEDELGNGDEDSWYFTVDDFSDDSNTEDTTWGVIKDKF